MKARIILLTVLFVFLASTAYGAPFLRSRAVFFETNDYDPVYFSGKSQEWRMRALLTIDDPDGSNEFDETDLPTVSWNSSTETLNYTTYHNAVMFPPLIFLWW